jgi:hypothetical protein
MSTVVVLAGWNGIVEWMSLLAGTYAIIPSTYKPGIASRFRINLWTHTGAGSGYTGEPPKVASSGEACLVTDLGTNDLGYDAETLPEDSCEVEEETEAAQKASAETLVSPLRQSLSELPAVLYLRLTQPIVLPAVCRAFALRRLGSPQRDVSNELRKLKQVVDKQVRKRTSFEPLDTKNDPFTKTGSGQA